jgi:hypothetical protein
MLFDDDRTVNSMHDEGTRDEHAQVIDDVISNVGF